MYLGIVKDTVVAKGTVVAERKEAGPEGKKLLLVHRLEAVADVEPLAT